MYKDMILAIINNKKNWLIIILYTIVILNTIVLA